ncbi:hypothetical protein B9Z19DRAFT_1125779 [Tuber borchii]|uniref:BTB domain-containing protein n=1 Tax=Tuber borchii TaxID=42251 RepID=A0A2T6ZU41_TUBBO|nr:hypothetical protein B9Z19DRAFT_1125779 [Tuber borchii]
MPCTHCGNYCGYCVDDYQQADDYQQVSSKPAADSATTKHSPKYKDFLFGGNVTLYVGPKRKRMEIHKKLPASISPELDKHVNNNMREGIEGKIYLPEEGEEVLTLFTEWAYTGDYASKNDTLPANTGNPKEPKHDPWPSLHKHLQLCAFADKFNVPILKHLAESKFHTEIGPVTIEPNCSRDVSGLSLVIGYAYDNLPSSDWAPKRLALYAAWYLELLRETTSFNDLVLSQPDFLKELLRNVNGQGATSMASPKYTQKATTPSKHHHKQQRRRK